MGETATRWGTHGRAPRMGVCAEMPFPPRLAITGVYRCFLFLPLWILRDLCGEVPVAFRAHGPFFLTSFRSSLQ